MTAEVGRIFESARLDSLILFVTNACNLRCWFCCYADNLNQTRDIPFDDLMKLSASMPRFRALLVSGGEPFIRPRLDEILLGFVRNNGVRSIYIPTNGWYLDRTKAACEKFLTAEREAMLTLSFSVDGLETTHDAIRTKGKGGAFAALCATIEELSPWRERYPNLRLRLNSVVTPDNVDEMPATVDYFHQRYQLDEHALEIVRDLDTLRAHHDSADRRAIADRYQAAVEYAYRLYYLTDRRTRRPQFATVPPMVSDLATHSFAVATSQVKVDRIKGRLWPFPCTAGERIMVVSGSGSLSACEHREPVLDLRDYDFDFRKALASEVMTAEVARIRAERCDCLHGCFVGNSLQHSPRAVLTRMLPIAAKSWLAANAS